jgi:hypothetical protein
MAFAQALARVLHTAIAMSCATPKTATSAPRMRHARRAVLAELHLCTAYRLFATEESTRSNRWPDDAATRRDVATQHCLHPTAPPVRFRTTFNVLSAPKATPRASNEGGRGDWTRTSDPLLPKQVRYHCATPRTVLISASEHGYRNGLLVPRLLRASRFVAISRSLWGFRPLRAGPTQSGEISLEHRGVHLAHESGPRS